MSATSVDGGAPRRTGTGLIRRHRIINSCLECRTRRVKCDKVHPSCGRCSKEGKSCVYVSQESEKEAHTSNGEDHAPSKRRRLNSSDSSRQKNGATVSSGDGGQNGSDRDESDTGGSSNDPKNGRLGHLTLQNGGRSRYVGSTFWACFGEQNREFDELVTSLPVFPFHGRCCCEQTLDNSDDLRRETEVGNSGKLGFRTGETHCERYYSLPRVLDELPAKHVCDSLYSSYVDSIQPIIPLLHLPTFRDQYDRFWTWLSTWNRQGVSDGVLAETPSFLPLLFAVLFAGSISNTSDAFGPPTGGFSGAVLSTKLYRLSTQSLALVSFPQSPTIYSLVSFLIGQNMLIREEESLSSCSFISVALRVAQAMGLHRDGRHFGLDPVQAEIRRRIWWHIIHTDVMTSICSGLPPVMLTDEIYDTRMVSELNDEMITAHVVADPKDPNSMTEANRNINLGLFVAVGRYSITTFMRSLLRRQFEVRQMKMSEIEEFKRRIDILHAQITERVKRIEQMESCPTDPQRHSPGTPDDMIRESVSNQNAAAFRLWSQRLLQLMMHRAYCMLYQPLIRASGGKWWHRVRKECVRHCHEFVRLFLEMCTTQDFHPFYWIYPGMYQPLQATAMLLADLIKCPNSTEAKRSRDLVEKIFSLLSEDGVAGRNGISSQRQLSAGGKEAWSMLRKVKRQAWEKAGFDPNAFREESKRKETPQSSSRDDFESPHSNAKMESPASLGPPQSLMYGTDMRLPTPIQAYGTGGTNVPSQFPPMSGASVPPVTGAPLNTGYELPQEAVAADPWISPQTYDSFDQVDLTGLSGGNGPSPGNPDDIDWREWDALLERCFNHPVMGDPYF